MPQHQQDKRTPEERREKQFLDWLEEILYEHQDDGFTYPILTVGGVKLTLPVRVSFITSDSYSFTEIFKDTIRYGKDGIVIDIYRLFDQQKTIDKIMDSDQKITKVPIIRQSYMETRHLYNTPNPEIVECMLSEVLGSFLLDHLLKQHPGSWLNGASLPADIIKGGIRKYFFHLYQVAGDSISAEVWDRFTEDQEALLAFWGAREFKEKAGYSIVDPILKDFRQEGLIWLLENAPTMPNGYEVLNLPAYVDEAFHELSELPYE